MCSERRRRAFRSCRRTRGNDLVKKKFSCSPQREFLTWGTMCTALKGCSPYANAAVAGLAFFEADRGADDIPPRCVVERGKGGDTSMVSPLSSTSDSVFSCLGERSLQLSSSLTAPQKSKQLSGSAFAITRVLPSKRKYADRPSFSTPGVLVSSATCSWARAPRDECTRSSIIPAF